MQSLRQLITLLTEEVISLEQRKIKQDLLSFLKTGKIPSSIKTMSDLKKMLSVMQSTGMWDNVKLKDAFKKMQGDWISSSVHNGIDSFYELERKAKETYEKLNDEYDKKSRRQFNYLPIAREANPQTLNYVQQAAFLASDALWDSWDIPEEEREPAINWLRNNVYQLIELGREYGEQFSIAAKEYKDTQSSSVNKGYQNLRFASSNAYRDVDQLKQFVEKFM